jgi:hypothetical protein
MFTSPYFTSFWFSFPYWRPPLDSPPPPAETPVQFVAFPPRDHLWSLPARSVMFGLPPRDFMWSLPRRQP